MAIDLTSGMDASSDHFLAERPDEPQFRESASMWIFDQRGEIALPRCGIESIATSWDTRDIQVWSLAYIVQGETEQEARDFYKYYVHEKGDFAGV